MFDKLDRFIRLAGDPAEHHISDFARLHGVLSAHNEPLRSSGLWAAAMAATNPKTRNSEPAFRREPVELWRLLAREFKFLATRAASLRAGLPTADDPKSETVSKEWDLSRTRLEHSTTHSGDYERMFGARPRLRTDPPRRWWTGEEPTDEELISGEMANVESHVSRLLQLSQVRPAIRREGDTLSVAFEGSGLFGLLALALWFRVGSREDTYWCSGCDRFFTPAGDRRTPRRGFRSFCTSCSGGAHRLAQRRYDKSEKGQEARKRRAETAREARPHRPEPRA
jgi:hypothetical protein